jgi:hypothetical protein
MSYLLSLLLLSSLTCFYGFSVSRGKSCAIGSSALRMSAEFALLFDCDGVIVETEELHRLAYNKAFAKFGLTLNEESVEWTVAYYDILQNTVGGGKPKMKHYFNTEKGQWPASASPLIAAYETAEERDRLVDELQDAKTEYYKEIVGSVATARPGVLELMDEALADPRIKVSSCTSNHLPTQHLLSCCASSAVLGPMWFCVLLEGNAERKCRGLVAEGGAERECRGLVAEGGANSGVRPCSADCWLDVARIARYLGRWQLWWWVFT